MVLKHLKNKGVDKIDFKKLDHFMKNSQNQQFNYETFAAAYDSDPRLQNLVTNFDEESVEIKQSEMDDLPKANQSDNDTVSNMAQNAVDLGSL